MPLRPTSSVFINLTDPRAEVDLGDQMPTARASRLSPPSGAAALAPRDTELPRGTLAPRQPFPAHLDPSQSAHALAFAAAPRPLAHLSTTPTLRIPESAKERIGVAIWMKPRGEASLDDRDRRYGTDFRSWPPSATTRVKKCWCAPTHTDADQLPPLKSRVEQLFRHVLSPSNRRACFYATLDNRTLLSRHGGSNLERCQQKKDIKP